MMLNYFFREKILTLCIKYYQENFYDVNFYLFTLFESKYKIQKGLYFTIGWWIFKDNPSTIFRSMVSLLWWILYLHGILCGIIIVVYLVSTWYLVWYHFLKKIEGKYIQVQQDIFSLEDSVSVFKNEANVKKLDIAWFTTCLIEIKPSISERFILRITYYV